MLPRPVRRAHEDRSDALVTEDKPYLLAMNCGSSSIKFSLYPFVNDGGDGFGCGGKRPPAVADAPYNWELDELGSS